MLLPRAVIEKVGYLDETLFMYCEDVDYCIRLAQVGVPMWFLPDAVIHHKAGGSAGGMLSVYYITRNTLYLTCKGKSAAYAKLKTILPLLTGAARYALTKLLGRKKAAATARSEVPWILERENGADERSKLNVPQITIVILQYRPDAAALRRTLASLAMQDTRDFAVVLGDDGSAQDYFAESRAYLAAHGITDVQTTKLQPNGGTVKNARNAVRAAATRWVLMLSPGDFLYDSETLRWWLGRLQADEPRVAFGRQAYFTPDPPQPTAGETPFDRTPYDPAHYDAKAIRRNLLLYDDGISGAGLVYERALFLSALDKMADHVRLAEDFSLRLFAVQGVRITRYDRLTVWYEYGGGVSTDAVARARMLGDWRAMLEVLRAEYPRDRTVRLAYEYYFNDRRKSRLVRGLVGRLIVPQNCPFKKAQRAWQPPTNGDKAKLRTVYEFAEKENAAE